MNLLRASLLRLATLGWVVWIGLACQPAPRFNGEVVEPPEGPLPLEGVNWDGEAFQLEGLRGQVVVVFFGYTFCPDICPYTLAKMKELRGLLGDEADEVAMVFVSVDPHRDSVEKLAGYVPGFDPRFYGVHLSFEQLEEAKESFGITVQYGQPKDGPGTDSFYYVDHTGTFFLLDREGLLRVKFPPNAKPEAILPDLRALLSL